MSIKIAEKVDPKEHNYICVKNVGVFYWDNSATEPDNNGALLRLEDI